MRYLQLNPETNPVRHEFMDGVEIESITNSQIYGYWSDNGGLLEVQEPGFYVSNHIEETGGYEFVKIDSYITSADRTQDYINGFDPEFAPPQTPENNVSASGFTGTFEGVSYTYFLRFHVAGGVDEFRLEDENRDHNKQVWLADSNRPVYIGTYNLANGTSVEITTISVERDKVMLYDSNDILHETSSIIDYQYYTIPGHPDLYFDKFSGQWCQPDGNGKYTIGDQPGVWPSKGSIIGISITSGNDYVLNRYYTENTPRENPPYYVNMTATTIYSGYTEPWIDDPEWYNKPEDERVPIEFYSGETTGWTVITLNYGHDAKIKDGNGNDVYLVWQNHDGLPADLYTGSTMQDLQWWTSDYDEHPDFIDFINYEVTRIPAEEDKVVTEFVVPGVAFETDGNSVYYNRTGVPVYDLDLEVNFFAVPKEAVFDATMHQHILYYRDFNNGVIRLAPAAVTSLWIDGVDRTTDFKNGVVTDIDLWKNRYKENDEVIGVEEFRMVFTDEFFMNGRLNATEDEGAR